jgi:hypothetical protein
MGGLLRSLLASLIALVALKCELSRATNGRPQDAQDPQTPAASASAASPFILVLGLPRSGSQQIHDFFECNGFRSAHYCCDETSTDPAIHNNTRFPCREQTCGACVHANLRLGQPAFHDCSSSQRVQVWSRFDLESQEPFSWFLPQHYALSALHQAYNNATWILNTRSSAKQWATNVLHWNTDTHRLLNAFGIPYYSSLVTNVVGYNNYTADIAPDVRQWTADQVYLELKRSLERAGNTQEYSRRLQALIQVYNRHSQWVLDANQHFGKSHPLVTLTVDDPNAGQVLAAAFPNTKASCWSFDADALDNDWQDFSLKLS